MAFGLVTLAWPHYYDWLQLRGILDARDGGVFAYCASAAQIFGGGAIQFRPTVKAGAVVLGAMYLVVALLSVPQVVAGPRVYDHWGNFFEQFCLATGAAIVYGRSSAAWAPDTLARIGRTLLGVCVASFTLEQAIYLDVTAQLVPKWLPPSQTFWAVTTTVAFALAAVALLTNRNALLATRLLTMMLVIFGLVVWVPLLLSNPHRHSNWGETVETFAIAGVAWILVDVLGRYRSGRRAR